MTAHLVPIRLLILSSIFTAFARYAHRGDMSRSLWLAVSIVAGAFFIFKGPIAA